MTLERVLVAAIFGACAWLGASVALRLYAGRAPFEDGPYAIAVRTWVVALAGLTVGFAVAARGGDDSRIAFLAAMTVAIAACVAADLRYGIVPDLFVLVPLEALVIYSALRGDYAPTLAALVVAAPFVTFAILAKNRPTAWGDVKFAALAGALLASREAVVAFAAVVVVAFVVSAIVRRRGNFVAFAPYLACGIAVVVIVGAR